MKSFACKLQHHEQGGRAIRDNNDKKPVKYMDKNAPVMGLEHANNKKKLHTKRSFSCRELICSCLSVCELKYAGLWHRSFADAFNASNIKDRFAIISGQKYMLNDNSENKPDLSLETTENKQKPPLD